MRNIFDTPIIVTNRLLLRCVIKNGTYIPTEIMSFQKLISDLKESNYDDIEECMVGYLLSSVFLLVAIIHDYLLHMLICMYAAAAIGVSTPVGVTKSHNDYHYTIVQHVSQASENQCATCRVDG